MQEPMSDNDNERNDQMDNAIPDQILPEFILLDLITDGGSVHNSGRKTFWTIQLRPLNILNKKPFIAGVFLGNTKPTNVFEFSQPFLQEIREIAEEGGIEVRGRRFPLRFRPFIADAPARAFCLNHFSQNSYFPCSKWWIEARPCENPRFSRSRPLSGVNHRLRTDEQYKNMVDDDHHKGPSPLSRILGLVTQVPLDVMHLVYLDAVRKFVSLHLLGNYD